MSVVVMNPHRRGAILAVHAGLTREEARDLVRVYRCLGYEGGAITVTPQQQEAA